MRAERVGNREAVGNPAEAVGNPEEVADKPVEARVDNQAAVAHLATFSAEAMPPAPLRVGSQAHT